MFVMCSSVVAALLVRVLAGSCRCQVKKWGAMLLFYKDFLHPTHAEDSVTQRSCAVFVSTINGDVTDVTAERLFVLQLADSFPYLSSQRFREVHGGLECSFIRDTWIFTRMVPVYPEDHSLILGGFQSTRITTTFTRLLKETPGWFIQ